MQSGSCSSPIQLANLKDHTTYSEGQHPINITLNKTSFHAEKTAHQQTHGLHTRTAWLTVKAEHKQEHCGRSWICTLSSVLTTPTGTLAKKERSKAGEHGASPGLREGAYFHQHCWQSLRHLRDKSLWFLDVLPAAPVRTS